MLGINKVHLGDCLERMKEIDSRSIDMVLCDLPYGTTVCAWDSVIPLEPMWRLLERIIKWNGAILLTSSQPFTTILISSRMELFRYEWIWEKERPTNIFAMRKRPGKVHENVCVFYDNQPVYNPITTASIQQNNNDKRRNKSQSGDMNLIETIGGVARIAKGYDPKRRQPRSVLKIARGTRRNKKQHPTQKPVPLMEYLIKTYTNEGDVVLDFAAGSGTTGVACIRTKRNFILIESDKKYWEKANNRIKVQRRNIGFGI